MPCAKARNGELRAPVWPVCVEEAERRFRSFAASQCASAASAVRSSCQASGVIITESISTFVPLLSSFPRRGDRNAERHPGRVGMRCRRSEGGMDGTHGCVPDASTGTLIADVAMPSPRPLWPLSSRNAAAQQQQQHPSASGAAAHAHAPRPVVSLHRSDV